jgi:hypothetical protein
MELASTAGAQFFANVISAGADNDSCGVEEEIAARRYAHRQADAMLPRALEMVSHLSEAQRVRTAPQLRAILAAHRGGWPEAGRRQRPARSRALVPHHAR